MKNFEVSFSLLELAFHCEKLFDMGKVLGSKENFMKNLMVAFFICNPHLQNMAVPERSM